MGGPGCWLSLWLRWWLVQCCTTLLPTLCLPPSLHQPHQSIFPLSPSPPWQMELEAVMPPPPASPLPKPGPAISLDHAQAPVWGESGIIQGMEQGSEAGKGRAAWSWGWPCAVAGDAPALRSTHNYPTALNEALGPDIKCCGRGMSWRGRGSSSSRQTRFLLSIGVAWGLEPQPLLWPRCSGASCWGPEMAS